MRGKFQVGDRVVIKDFDDMADEFGVDRFGDIKPSNPDAPCFNRAMKKYCGAAGKIVRIGERISYRRIYIDFDNDNLINNYWVFVDYMVIAEQDILSMPDVACLYGA